MNILYAHTAVTIKDFDKINHWLYRGISNNMLKYNHDCSNILRVIDALGMPLYNDFIDVNYQFNLGLSNVDFTMIDRINKFKVSYLKRAIIDDSSNTITIGNQINADLVGFSSYTGKTYLLKNVNILSDMLRHSLPCDLLIEKNKIDNIADITLNLSSNVKQYINSYINNSKITIYINSSLDLDSSITGTVPTIEIKGWNEFNEYTYEVIQLRNNFEIISNNLYSKVESLLCVGPSNSINITFKPYEKNSVIMWDDLYTEREEFDEYIVYSYIDNPEKCLRFISEINDGSYPPNYDLIDKYNLEIDTNEDIVDYLLDQNNKILSIVTKNNTTGLFFIYKFPLLIPYSRKNLKNLRSSDDQFIKISYSRDGANRKFNIYTFPTEKQNNIDALYVTITRLIDTSLSLGEWVSGTSYFKNDIVLRNGLYFICKEDNNEGAFLVGGSLAKWIPQITTEIDGTMLDLLSYNIETNLLELSFDNLFPCNEEALVRFETTGNSKGYCEVILQNPNIKYIFKKPLDEIFNIPSVNIPSNILTPIPNDNNILLIDNIESYKVNDIDLYSTFDEFKLFSITSTNSEYINGYKTIDIYDTFFVDGTDRTIITSDTITHIINN